MKMRSPVVEPTSTAESTPRYLTLAEAATRLRSSKGYVYGLVVRRELPAIELPSSGNRRRRGRILIAAADLETFIAAHKTEAA